MIVHGPWLARDELCTASFFCITTFGQLRKKLFVIFVIAIACAPFQVSLCTIIPFFSLLPDFSNVTSHLDHIITCCQPLADDTLIEALPHVPFGPLDEPPEEPGTKNLPEHGRHYQPHQASERYSSRLYEGIINWSEEFTFFATIIIRPVCPNV
ncbi:hypothetical protein RvY_01405 [Ramazzottius varieornatus]|uniref:Uncharacterized protein n=1 Tax=Ramazzottius varieornatus TaxID=947166 RepID=A0A1D1UG75_RAMVA|nr:hypothetical protein RvY_01405 [Ramazzottius varieornatus]